MWIFNKRYARYCLIVVGCLILGGVLPVQAACLLAEQAQQNGDMKKAVSLYEECALKYNDDVSHLYLARMYQKGAAGVSANQQRALLFYHLAAENGNAEAQYEFAQLLLKMDESSDKRAEIRTYLSKVKSALSQQKGFSFKGELLHPYTWMMLAAEKPSEKWYYVSTNVSAPQAGYFLAHQTLDKDKRQHALKEAAAWKKTHLLAMAQEVLSASEYRTFQQMVYPEKGRADAFQRQQALDDLKEKIQMRRAVK